MIPPAPSNRQDDADGLLLPGLDGANPLGFLAALGTLQALSLRDNETRMTWMRVHGGWSPRVSWSREIGEDVLSETLRGILNCGSPDPTEKMRSLHARYTEDDGENARALWLQACYPSLLIGDNTTLPAEEFRKHLELATERTEGAKWKLDLYAALGTEVPDDKGIMQDTALRTMSGAGHQHFLRFGSNLLAQVTEEHLRKALLEEWVYDDPVRNLTLRLDPLEDARYALQWGNPSKDSTRKDSGSVLGANALAVLGLSVLATVPTSNRTKIVAKTVGFRGRGARNTYWRWPIWEHYLSLDVARSLFCSSELMVDEEIDASLLQRGVAAVYESQRLTVGKYRNFTPAQRIA